MAGIHHQGAVADEGQKAARGLVGILRQPDTVLDHRAGGLGARAGNGDAGHFGDRETAACGERQDDGEGYDDAGRPAQNGTSSAAVTKRATTFLRPAFSKSMASLSPSTPTTLP